MLTTKSYYHYIKIFEETIVNRDHSQKFQVRTYRYERIIDLFEAYDIYIEENKKQLASIYLHQVIECFEMYFYEKCLLTPNEKKKQIKEMLQGQTVQQSMAYFNQGKSRYTKLVLKSMKLNNSFFCLYFS